MLYWSFLLPFNFSKQLAGGIRRSFNEQAAFSIHSLRIAVLWIEDGSLNEYSLLNIFSVSLQQKLFIILIHILTHCVNIVKR